MNELDYKIAGDRGILIYFGGNIGLETFQRIRLFNENLLRSNLPGVKETFPGFRTLFVSYELSETNYDTLVYQLKELAQNPPSREYEEEVCFEIPILYDGPDLPMVAKLLNTSAQEIIQRHSGDKYLILLTGGAGGIAYFKFRDRLFDLPRKKTPAFKPTDGAVGFAAGIGTAGSRDPQGTKGKGQLSGWWFIGRTPIRQWLPDRDPPVVIEAGNWVRYKRIDADDFERIAQEVDRGTYVLKVCKT